MTNEMEDYDTVMNTIITILPLWLFHDNDKGINYANNHNLWAGRNQNNLIKKDTQYL